MNFIHETNRRLDAFRAVCGGSLRQIESETSLSYSWLRRYSQGYGEHSTVTNVQTLYDYLADKVTDDVLWGFEAGLSTDE